MKKMHRTHVLRLLGALALLWSVGHGWAAQDAEFVAQSVPGQLEAGVTYTFSQTWRNRGDTTWSFSSHYALGSQNPQDNSVWSVSRVTSPREVAPGETETFTFSIRAPVVLGTYHFQWRLVQDGVTWFGDTSPD